MDARIKRLLEFCVEDPQSILVTPCELKEEEWFKDLEFVKDIRCTSTRCEEGDKNCIKMDPQGVFLPFEKFNIWLINLEEFPYSPGYAFYLGYESLKDFGIIAIVNKVDESMDSVALSYGFQILYHGAWHYYLKAGKRKEL